MGITQQHALMIMREHMYRPLPETVHLLGRQTVHFDYETARGLFDLVGLEAKPVEVEIDRDTLDSKVVADSQFISDRTFFEMLGVKEIRAIDHSDYEGADIIIDLNRPIGEKEEGSVEFLFGGSVCDNVFNPAGYIQNVARLLKPGGRLLDQNVAVDRHHPYVILPPEWYFDYFVLNKFADCKVYIFEIEKFWNVYHLEGPDVTRRIIDNFPQASIDVTLGVFIIAEKGEGSTWEFSPAQDQYRGEQEWRRFDDGLLTIRRHPRPINTFPIPDPGMTMCPKPQEIPGYNYIGRFEIHRPI
jgi:SAM-dependent methyltransferase